MFFGSLARRWHQRAGFALGGGRLEREGEIESEDHPLGRSRGGTGSRLHMVLAGRGTPLAADITAGEAHESTQLERPLREVRPTLREGWP